jgi:hypothetical protein
MPAEDEGKSIRRPVSGNSSKGTWYLQLAIFSLEENDIVLFGESFL